MKRKRAKISVSLSPELIQELDWSVEAGRYPSRSAALEAALLAWAKGERDAEIEAYYRSRSPAEAEEERLWGELGFEALCLENAPSRPVRGRRRRRARVA